MQLWDIQEELAVRMRMTGGNIMKKISVFLFCIILVFSYSKNFYAYEYKSSIDVMETNTSNGGVVTKDTIFQLNEKYNNNEKNIKEEAYTFLIDNSARLICTGEMIYVLGDEGYADYGCIAIREGASTPVEYVILQHVITGMELELNVSEEKLKEYFEITEEIGKSVRKQVQYIQQNFTEDEYGGVFYDKEMGKVCAYVSDASIRPILEREGIWCLEESVSLGNLYNTLQTIWQYKDEFGINYIEVDQCNNRLNVYTDNRDKLLGWLESNDITCCEVLHQVMIHPGYFYSVLEDECESVDLDQPDETIRYSCISGSDELKDSLLEGLKILKEAYPEYDSRNLLLRISADAKYDRYLDFEEELLEYVNTLPAYIPNIKNPAEELLFGDPQRIELKSMLREYQELYPEMTYEEIYEKYLLNWEDMSVCSREKKLYDLTINRQTGELSGKIHTEEENNDDKKNQDIENQAQKKTAIFPAIVIVCGAAVLSGIIICMIKKKHMI